MNKKLLFTAAAASVLVFGAVSAYAEVSGSGNFYYRQEGNAVYVDLNGDVDLGDHSGAEVIWGFYDGDKLINTSMFRVDSHISSFDMNETRIVLPYTPENLAVKAFVWSDDGNCTPMADAEKLSYAPQNAVEYRAEVSAIDVASGNVTMKLPTDEGMKSVTVNVGDTDLAMHVREVVNVKLTYDGNAYKAVDYSVDESSMKKILLNDFSDKDAEELSSSVSLIVNGESEGVLSNSEAADEIEKYKSINEYSGASVMLRDNADDSKYDIVRLESYSKAEISGLERNSTSTKISLTGYSGDLNDTYTVEDDAAYVYNKNGKLLSLNELMVGDTVYVREYTNSGSGINNIIIDNDRDFVNVSDEYTELNLNDIFSTLYINNSANGAQLYGALEYNGAGTPEYLDAELTLDSQSGSQTINIPLWSELSGVTFNGSTISDMNVSGAELVLKKDGIEVFSTNVPVNSGAEQYITAKGKIVDTSINNDSLNDGEVSVLIDGKTYTMKTSLDINIMYEYSNITYSVNNGEYILQSVEPIYKERVHTISSDDIINKYSSDMITHHCIPLFEDGDAVGGYKLSDDVRLFVNGEETYASDRNAQIYLADNIKENIYLVDEVNPDSVDEGMGVIDYIFVDYMSEAVVDHLSIMDDANILFFAQASSDVYFYRIKWDPSTVNVRVFKDGQEIGIEDIKKNDVVSIKYDISEGFENSDYYDVYVTSSSISGKVDAVDYEKNAVTVDGTEYLCSNLSLASEYDLHVVYNFYLNKNGYISYGEEDLSKRNYGMVTGMFVADGSEFATVQYMDKFGNSKEYKCTSEEEENVFYGIALGDTRGYEHEYNAETITMSDIMSQGIENSVFSYLEYDGKIEVIEHMDSMMGGDDMNYDIKSKKIGGLQMDINSTSITYISPDGTAEPVSMENLVDGEYYTAYTYDRIMQGPVLFVLITGGEIVEDPTPVNTDRCTGVVMGIYKNSYEERAYIEIANENAEIVKYQCKDAEEENKFYTVFRGEDPDDGVVEYDGKIHTHDYVVNNGLYNSVCSYSVKDGKLEFIEKHESVGGTLVYNQDGSSLGDYRIDDTVTKFVDFEDYLDKKSEKPLSLSKSNLADGSEYSAYLFDPDENGTYKYCIFVERNDVIDSDTPISVVQGEPELVTIDGKEYAEVNVFTCGIANYSVLFEDTTIQLSQGDIIILAVDENRVVKEYSVIVKAQPDYDVFKDSLCSTDDFMSLVNPDALLEEGSHLWKWNDERNEQTVYFGPVYRSTDHSLLLITSKNDGISDLYSDTKEFVVDQNTNVYEYSYGAKPGAGVRVSNSTFTSISDAYIRPAEDDDGNIIWDKIESENLSPVWAFVRADDFEIKDVVIYMPD